MQGYCHLGLPRKVLTAQLGFFLATAMRQVSQFPQDALTSNRQGTSHSMTVTSW